MRLALWFQRQTFGAKPTLLTLHSKNGGFREIAGPIAWHGRWQFTRASALALPHGARSRHRTRAHISLLSLALGKKMSWHPAHVPVTTHLDFLLQDAFFGGWSVALLL